MKHIRDTRKGRRNMARAYVEKDGEWNVFSTVVDDFLYSSFMSFDELKALVVGEVVITKIKDLETLLTDRPVLCTMPFDEAMDIIERRYGRQAKDDE